MEEGRLRVTFKHFLKNFLCVMTIVCVCLCVWRDGPLMCCMLMLLLFPRQEWCLGAVLMGGPAREQRPPRHHV